jgi:hypothetical protein
MRMILTSCVATCDAKAGRSGKAVEATWRPGFLLVPKLPDVSTPGNTVIAADTSNWGYWLMSQMRC